MFCKDQRVRIIGMVLGCLVVGIVLFKSSQTGVWKTILVNKVGPLASNMYQEPSRGKYLFHPVGSSPEKPDAIKIFLQRMRHGCLLKEKKCVVDNHLAVEKPVVEKSVAEKLVVEKSVARNYVIEKNKEILEDKIEDTRFRFYIWRDMVLEYRHYKPLFGFSFGRPQYSPAIFKYNWVACTEYTDGWVGAHNSFLYMIYRAGIIGLAMILALVYLWGGLLRDFYSLKDWTGILLCAILLNWFISADFFLIFELPYTAIPVWTILGITIKHRMLPYAQNHLPAKG